MQSAKEVIPVELQLAVDTLHGEAVNTATAKVNARWNEAIAAIDTTGQS